MLKIMSKWMLKIMSECVILDAYDNEEVYEKVYPYFIFMIQGS